VASLTGQLHFTRDELTECEAERDSIRQQLAGYHPDATNHEQAISTLTAEKNSLRRKFLELQVDYKNCRGDIDKAHKSYDDLCFALLHGGLRLAHRAKLPQPGYVLRQHFCDFRDGPFLNLAQLLGSGEADRWQIELTRHVFLQGARHFLLALLMRADPTTAPSESDEQRLLCTHRDEVNDALRRAIAPAGVRLDGQTGELVEETIEGGLLLAWDVLASPAPGWLVLPAEGAPFDPKLHETSGTRAPRGALIDKVIFPGYVMRGSPDTVDKARVIVR
jgi:hypothetical protein